MEGVFVRFHTSAAEALFFVLKEFTVALSVLIAIISSLATIRDFPIVIVLSGRLFHDFNWEQWRQI
jgi:hypothetical protein